MAKASKETTPTTMDFEVVEDRSCELDGFTVNFVTIRRDQDLTPMLASLPGGLCQCPHWGVMTKGQMTVRYADRSEVIEAGDSTVGHRFLSPERFAVMTISSSESLDAAGAFCPLVSVPVGAD